MADTERLINKDQGDSIIAAIQGITSRLQEMYTVDDAVSSSSENPVQNKVITAALDNKVDKVEGKGLSSNDYTDEDKAALDNMELDIESTQTVTGNPITLTDCAPINAESLVVEFEPIQDLHGQSAPYVGGAGKNKLPMTVEGLKAANTHGTWNGNEFTWNGITFTVLTDNGGNVTGIDVNGTLTGGSASRFVVGKNITLSGSYLISGGLSSSLYIQITNAAEDTQITTNTGGDTSLSTFDNYVARIIVTASVSHTVLYPMLRLSTETDPTFAPYSNICPITGYTECNVDDVGKNLFDDNGEVTVYNIDTGGTQRAGYKKTLLAGTYTISAQNGASGAYLDAVLYKDDEFTNIGRVVDTTTLHSFTFTIDTAKELRIFDAASAQTSIAEQRIKTAQFQVELGQTATAYEPYHFSNATIQFGQTVYGGKSNFTDGGTDDEYDRCDLGDLSYSILNNVFIGTMPANVKQYFDGICEGYKKTTKQYNELLDGEWTSQSGEGMVVWIKNSNYSDATAFKNAMAGIKLVYEKATASTLSTPPTDLKLLKGTNNLTTNGTTINLGYQPDNVIGEVKGEIEKCAVDAEFMQFTDGTDTFTDVNLSLDALSHTVSVVGSKIEQKRFICFEVMDKMGGVLQGILASCIAFTDGANTPSGTAFRAYIESLQMYVNFRIYGSGGSYTLAYQSESSFSASAFYVRVRMMNNL